MPLLDDHPEAWCRGVEAGLSGLDAACPFELGSQQAWSWYHGLIDGQARHEAMRLADYRPGSFSAAWRKGIESGAGGRAVRCPYRKGSLQEWAWHAGFGGGQAKRAQAVVDGTRDEPKRS